MQSIDVPFVRYVIMLMIGLSAGCIPEYRAPTFDQPHATLKLRRLYSQGMGLSVRAAGSGREPGLCGHRAFRRSRRDSGRP